MNTIRIKTHKMKNSYTGNFFFLLSKGLNAGKPLDRPCPNCFVVFAKNETERSLLFWLCFGLWQGLYFQQFLTGSVIPFIRIDDIKNIVNDAVLKIEMKNIDVFQSLETIEKLNQYQINISQQLKLIKQMQRAMMEKILKE